MNSTAPRWSGTENRHRQEYTRHQTHAASSLALENEQQLLRIIEFNGFKVHILRLEPAKKRVWFNGDPFDHFMRAKTLLERNGWSVNPVPRPHA